MVSVPNVKVVVHRPLFWAGIALLLVPTVWFAIDTYATWGMASESPSHAKTAFVIFALAMSYAPGLICLFVATFSKRIARNETPRSSS